MPIDYTDSLSRTLSRIYSEVFGRTKPKIGKGVNTSRHFSADLLMSDFLLHEFTTRTAIVWKGGASISYGSWATVQTTSGISNYNLDTATDGYGHFATLASSVTRPSGLYSWQDGVWAMDTNTNGSQYQILAWGQNNQAVRTRASSSASWGSWDTTPAAQYKITNVNVSLGAFSQPRIIQVLNTTTNRPSDLASIPSQPRTATALLVPIDTSNQRIVQCAWGCRYWQRSVTISQGVNSGNTGTWDGGHYWIA